MADLDLDDKRVLIREDLNVPMENGKITSDERIKAALPTIRFASEAGARVIVMSHLGRPTEGKFEEQYSLAPLAAALSVALKKSVPLIRNWNNGLEVGRGEVVLLENVRFNVGEKNSAEKLSRAMAKLCDVFVMDAFATAHRAEASTVGVTQYAPVACAGPLLARELHALALAFDEPTRPLVAIVGGSKVSTKFQLLETLLDKVDQLIVGGGIANTFLKAQGYEIGKSLYEPEWVAKAKQLLALAEQKGVTIPLPVDVVVAESMTSDAKAEVRLLSDIKPNEAIFDVGPKTRGSYASLMAKAKTIVWNGPVGVFEIEQFSQGTKALAEAIAKSDAYSLAGGGDTLAALSVFNIRDEISYISTGGGAFLEYLEGRELPAVSALKQRFPK